MLLSNYCLKNVFVEENHNIAFLNIDISTKISISDKTEMFTPKANLLGGGRRGGSRYRNKNKLYIGGVQLLTNNQKSVTDKQTKIMEDRQKDGWTEKCGESLLYNTPTIL